MVILCVGFYFVCGISVCMCVHIHVWGYMRVNMCAYVCKRQRTTLALFLGSCPSIFWESVSHLPGVWQFVHAGYSVRPRDFPSTSPVLGLQQWATTSIFLCGFWVKFRSSCLFSGHCTERAISLSCMLFPEQLPCFPQRLPCSLFPPALPKGSSVSEFSPAALVIFCFWFWGTVRRLMGFGLE